MHINLSKYAKLGGLVMAGALASSMAHATTFNIGGFEVNMDTTLTTGVTWLVSDRNNSYSTSTEVVQDLVSWPNI